MSAQEDKDLTAPRASPGRDRATLRQIKLMCGEISVEGDKVIRIGMWHQREVWRRVSGHGPKAIYEREGDT